MPYKVVKRSGPRPYKIINLQTGRVVGSSTSSARARRSIGYRMAAEGKPSKRISRWKRKVDNRMRGYGDTDYKKSLVRINKSKKKNKKPGEILDSIVHEKQHILHPRKHEGTVRKETAKSIRRMSRKDKQWHYGLFKSRRWA